MSAACQQTDGLLLLLQAAKKIDTEFEPKARLYNRLPYANSWKNRPSQRPCHDSKYRYHNGYSYETSKRPIATTRRAHLRNCVEHLKKCLAFDTDAPRITTLSILKKAVTSIKQLQYHNQHLVHQEEYEKKRSMKLLRRQQILHKRREEKRNRTLKCWERNRNSSECSINTTSSGMSHVDYLISQFLVEDSEIDAHLRYVLRSDLTASHGLSSTNRHALSAISGTNTYLVSGMKRTMTSRPPSGLDAFDASSLDSGFEELNTRSQSASPDNPSDISCITLHDLHTTTQDA